MPPVEGELTMTDKHEHLDEGTIHAWLDGALSPDESGRVESLSATCAECAALVAEARGLIAASSRILSSLDAVPAGVIPGTSANVDQLAALRARQRASSRRWWQDRRVMVAASLVFVAGISSLVWRRSPADVTAPTQLTVESARTEQDQAPPVPAPSAAPPATRQAPQANATSETRAAARDMAQARAAAPAPADSSVERKALVQTAPPPAAPPVLNESRRADAIASERKLNDSVAKTAQLAIQRPLRQEGTRQSLQQQSRIDSIQAAAPAAATLGAGLRGGVVTGGVGAAVADVARPSACYRLRSFPAANERPVPIADTVKLLQEQVPIRSDPSWFRTETFGALRDTTLAWRSVDSLVVELRSRFGADSVGVRFVRTGTSLDTRGSPGIQSVLANRILCP